MFTKVINLKRNYLILMFLIIPLFGHAQERIELGYEWATSYKEKYVGGSVAESIRKNGLVPDKETAIKIAVSNWTPIYGKEQIEFESPYFAYLVDDYWVVTGSLPTGYKGGTAKAIISKFTGEIVHVTHYK